MEDPSQKQHDPAAEEQPLEQPAGAIQPKPQAFYPGLPTGTGLGKYRILERLRSTHNAVIYKARDSTLDRLVTVKQMSPALIDNPIACGHFKREAQFLARIPKDAKHVINIHELIEDQLGLFIVEEYVDGHWLESLIAKRQSDPSAAVRILKTAAAGLRTIHSLDLMHRGICPSNLMVGRNNGVKIANLTTASHESDTTPPPTLIPKYTAPELLLERGYDNRVDIYSLGFSIYEYCVGRIYLHRHFGGELDAPASAIGFWTRWHTDLSSHLPDASEANPLIPEAMASILRRMTAKRLDDRYASIQEVLDEIGQYLQLSAEQRERGRLTPLRALPPPFAPSAVTPGYLLESARVPPGAPAAAPPMTWPVDAPRTSRLMVSQLAEASAPRAVFPQGRPAGTEIESEEARILAQARRERIRHKPGWRPPPRPVKPKSIPMPEEVVEVHRPRHPHLVAWVLSAVLATVCVAAAVVMLWHYYFSPAAAHPIERLVVEGLADYEHGDFTAARGKLREAAETPVDSQDLIQARDRAVAWLSMVEAQAALSQNDFDLALRHLRDAEKRGINPSAIAELQQRCWSRKDVYRLEEEGKKALQEGRLTEAELALDEYKQKAQDAGVNGSKLETQIRESRADKKYDEAIERARVAIEKGEWDEASLALNDAVRIRSTSDTRRLSERVSKGKEKADLLLKGDNAMLEKDYAEAAAAYEQANQIEASVEAEQKARMAAAYVLFNKGEEALEKGDLLAAERFFSSSVWKFPTPQARTRLKKLAPAFDAARQVQSGEREAGLGNCAEAVRLIEEAIPRLPKAASEGAEDKLLLARQCAAVQRGDEAVKRGEWATALEAYEEARSLGRNGDILRKIEAVKAKMRP